MSFPCCLSPSPTSLLQKLLCSCKWDYSELRWCCKIGTAVLGAAPLSGAQAPSLSSGGLEPQSLPGSSCEVCMPRKSFHALPTLSFHTVLDRIVVPSSANPEHEDSQEKGERTGRGRVKINNTYEIHVANRLTAFLITDLYFREENKPRLFLLRILLLLVIHFCSTLQSSELNTATWPVNYLPAA